MLIVITGRATGQEEFVDPPSVELTRIPFTQYTGGVVVLQALLEDHKDTLNFILDTGSGGISLDSSTVLSLGLQPSEPERLIRGVGGIRKVGFLKNKRLRVNDLVIDSLNFHIIDYGILSTLYGQKIDGIIGYSVLSRYILKIDYETRELIFCSSGSIRYPKGGLLLRPRLTTLPFLSGSVKDADRYPFNFLFDIGAGLTVLFSEDYVQDSLLLKKKRKKYLKQGEGLGGKVIFELSVIRELKIGNYKFKNVPINIFDDQYNVTSYPVLGGLIGNDIFRRFNCILNYPKRQIFITPNKFFRDPFDYAYSGVELYMIDGRVLIGDIPKGSPADKAGLKAGDEVLSVNRRFGQPLNEYKQALQSTYGPVDLIVKRGEQLLEKRMKVINILSGKAISNQSIGNTFRNSIRIRTYSDATTGPFRNE
ncbi:retropepsin-like aspartic protease [Niabella terrae]